MLPVPETRYAKSADGTHIAYQVVDGGGGSGIDYVCLPPAVSNIEVIWESPQAARFMRRLARLGRYIHYDKRGQGMSDRDSGAPTIDQRVDDLVAVLDAAGVERGVLAGASEGGATAAVAAALHPERVTHLIVYGSFAKVERSPEYPIGVDTETFELVRDQWVERWGTPNTLTARLACPSMLPAGDAFIRWLNHFERQACSPGGHRASLEWIRSFDITSVLPTITTPTLVVHSASDAMIPPVHGRWIADHIPGATYLEVDGVDHLPWFGDQDKVLDAFESFVVGRPASGTAERQLATVLFTDIVDSTQRAAALGDAAWRRLLDDHDHVGTAQVTAHGGRLVKSTGDGMLATFERPGRAIAAAVAVRESLGTLGLDVRAGVHTGEIETRGDDVGGIAVHLASRVCGLAGAGEVLVSRTVTDLVVGSGYVFDDRGEQELKGVPGSWRVFALAG